MRIIFFGSPPEAAEALGSLLVTDHEIVAVYTQPDSRAGRGRRITRTAVKEFAESKELVVSTPATLRGNEVQLQMMHAARADLFVVVAYGQILPVEVLEIPKMGVVNIHPSLLPRYRGPSPVVTTILDGESETGVTVMLLDQGMDTGPILSQSSPFKLHGREYKTELQTRLFKEGAAMLPSVIDGLQGGTIVPIPQDESKATITQLVKRSDGVINWSVDAEQIDRMVRAYDTWPGAFTGWGNSTLKILDAEPNNEGRDKAGHVSFVDGAVYVGTGVGLLEIRRLQLEGRRAMTHDEFLQGHPEFIGAELGF